MYRKIQSDRTGNMKDAIVNFFTHIFDYSFVIQLLAIAAATVLLLGVEYKKFKPWRFVIDLVWLTATFIAVHLALHVFALLVWRGFTSDLPYFIGITIYTCVASKHKWINRLAMGSVVFSLCTVMAALGTIFGNAIEIAIDGFDIAVTKVLSNLIIIGCAALFFRYPLFKFETTVFDCALNVSCNLLSAALCVIYEYVRRSSAEMMRLSWKFSGFITVVLLFLFLINIATYFMTYGLCKERERALEYRVREQKSESLKELLALNEHKLSELREMRHDVKNQYAYMQMLIEKKKYGELKSYFDEIVGTLAKPLYACVDSGNALIDQALNLELAKAGESGVKMNTRVAVPAELPFSKSAILGLFTNVIDNAIEACLRENIEDPCVDVVLNMQGDYMLFCVTNPTTRADTETDALTWHTSKADKALHGYGVKIIRKIVKKHNGYHRCFIKGGNFVSESLLDTYYKENTGGGALLMNRITVAVCDDEEHTLDIISASVKKVFASHNVDAEVHSYKSASLLWAGLHEQSFGLLFLDINMPNTDGIAIGRKICGMKDKPDIIFVSSNSDRVFDTFAVNPFGFVRKANFIKDIASVIERYVAEKAKDAAPPLVRLELKERGKLVTLNASLIKYAECLRNEQVLYMDGQDDVVLRSRMTVLESELIKHDFIRIHKGYIVNCAYVKRFDGNSVTLTTGETLPVGRSKHNEAMDTYLEYIHKNGISIIG